MEILQDLFLPCLWAFLASVAFGLVYNIAFVAAAAIAVFSECMARLRRCPVTGYLQVALLPLVPGSGIYYAMRHCVAGETSLFLSTLLNTFGMAASLAVGAMLASTVLRILLPHLPQRHRDEQ